MELEVETTSLAGATRDRVRSNTSVQKFDQSGYHRWYNFVLGFSDQLVSEVLADFSVGPDAVVLDPFCGTGTTVIECAKRGIRAIGIDANPFAVFAAQTKSKFDLDADRIHNAAVGVQKRYREIVTSNRRFTSGKTFDYLAGSGMLGRGWISAKPLRKALALREAIQRCSDPEIRDVLLLALLADLPANIGNMRFGPQIHIGSVKEDVDPIPQFRKRVAAITEDVRRSNGGKGYKKPVVILGDSRSLKPTLRQGLADATPLIDFVICLRLIQRSMTTRDIRGSNSPSPT
ncbi:MAG: DNA methyltransferase [Rhizomicrobium sp.]